MRNDCTMPSWWRLIFGGRGALTSSRTLQPTQEPRRETEAEGRPFVIENRVRVREHRRGFRIRVCLAGDDCCRQAPTWLSGSPHPAQSAQIRFTRMGRKKLPFYRIVAIDSRKRRDGRPIEVDRKSVV